MDDSLADEKNVVEINLYKSAFEIRVRDEKGLHGMVHHTK